MEVVEGLIHRALRANHFVFLLFCIAWIGFLLGVEPPPSASLEIQIVYVTGISLFSYGFLAYFGYFDLLKVVPRKSDLLLVLAATACAGVVQHTLTDIFFGAQISKLRVVFLWSPFIALFTFAAHYLSCVLLLRSGKRRKIVLDLLPEERQAIINEVVAHDRHQYIEFLTPQDLKTYLLRAAQNDIALIVISRGSASKFEEEGMLLRAHLAGIPVVDYRDVITSLSGRIRLAHTDLWTYLHGATPQTATIRAFWQLKNISEPALAVFLAILLSPVMALLAFIIRFTSNGPVFYRQTRTGYLGRNFTLIKFRSMYCDAEANGPQWSTENDDRVTGIGRFMRKTRLDELPQLWNVIRGEMSFCGPRPERPEIYRDLKKEIPLFSMRTVVRPGVTGWAQVCAGYAASVAESQTKLEYDLFYIQNMSPRLDFIILLKTLLVGIFGDKRPVRRVVTVSAPLAAES